ncbi:SCO0607 family lipoprotein [Streptomyces alkaliterrae]|uniref:SCO0607 family lipoprotein n=1 Tax=Streptomyces alkaliterrae TaxID=2213162 RepID=UPI00389A2915
MTFLPRPAARVRRARGLGAVAAALLAGSFAAVALTGCSIRDSICGNGEYPAMTIGGTGSQCVKNGEEVPEGYARYPEGKVPQKVDDKWDVYWRTHTVDKDGAIVEVADGE